MANQPYLVVERVTKTFGAFTALKDISLAIDEGEFVCFLGPSGCGKTTLLRAIAGLDPQTSGRVVQAGRDISALPPSERDFGIVFQSYALFPNLTVAANVAYGLENKKTPRAQVRARVEELLSLVGLSDQGRKFPAQLSGGQQQRVALARALANRPQLVLADEPTGNLDRRHAREALALIRETCRESGAALLLVSHDPEALAAFETVVRLDEINREKGGGECGEPG